MGEEFYCCIKLISGEEILSLISIDDNNGDPLIILQNPVTIKIINNNMGTLVKVKPWMEIPSDDIFIIKSDKIITMTEVKDEQTISIYKKYLSEDDSSELNIKGYNGESNRVKLSNKMGYVSSVEDARNYLENIFKDTKDTKDT